MKKMSKFLSFVCSVAMAASSFAGLAVTANAEDAITQGIDLVLKESSATEAVIDVVAVGVDEVSSWMAKIDLPETVSYTASFTSTSTAIVPIGNQTGTSYGVGGYAVAVNHVLATDGNVLATITLDFAEPITEDVTVTMIEGSTFAGKKDGSSVSLSVKKGTLAVDTVVVSAPVAPPTDAPTATPTATPVVITQGIDLVLKSSSDTEAVIDVVAVGVDEVSSWMAKIDLPETVSYTASFTSTSTAIVPIGNQTGTSYGVGGYAVAVNHVLATDGNVLATITLNFANPITEDVIVTMIEGSTFAGKKDGSSVSLSIKKNTLTADVLVVPVPKVTPAPTATIDPAATPAPTATADPTATPAVVERPTAKPTKAPVPTKAPAATPMVIDQGIDLVLKSSSDTEAVIDVVAVGVDEVSSWMAKIDLPETVGYTASFTSTSTAIVPIGNQTGTSYGVGGYAVSVNHVLATDGNVLATITLNFANPITEDVTVTMIEGSTFAGKKDGSSVSLSIKKGTLTGDVLVVPVPEVTPAPTATTAPKFEGDAEVKISDLINADKLEATLEDGATLEAWLSVEISGIYGTDYVALYNGNQLTEDEFSDLVYGYTEPDVKKVIAGLVISGNYGTTVSAAPVYKLSGKTYAYKDLGSTVTFEESKPTEAPTEAPTKKPSATDKPTTAPSKPTNRPATGGSSSSGGSGSGQIYRPSANVNNGSATTVTTTGFQDLGSVSWAATQINTLAALGILNGYSTTEFGPNGIVTRAEFTKMVCAALTIAPDASVAQQFTDVAPSDWFYGYVMAAAKAGVVNGVSDTAFDPNRTITRQEMATILYRAINATGMVMPTGTAKAFADAAQIADYAKEPVNALSAAGVINGTSATTFAPLESATRAQAACILYQYYQAIGAL